MNGARLDTTGLSARERRFLFAYLLSGNASASYLATTLQVGSQEYCTHTLGPRMLARIRRKLSWPMLLERLDIGALNLVRELEAELLARRTAEGDAAAQLLAECLQARAAELVVCKKTLEFNQ